MKGHCAAFRISWKHLFKNAAIGQNERRPQSLFPMTSILPSITNARFPNAWPYDRNEAMASALDDPAITGKQIFGMREDGEVWAFWFTFQRVRLYGKINLTSGGEIIIIYSAHVPNKGDKHL